MPYAISLNAVILVIHAIEIRKLPNAPEIINGIINLKGKIVPVADIRNRFGLVKHEMVIDDQLIITNTGKRDVAILVDKVIGIKEIEPGQKEKGNENLSFSENFKGVGKFDDGLILIYDLDQFLSLDEEEELEQAMNENIR